VVLGVVQLGLSYVLYTAAIKQVTALEATLFSMLEPILNPVWVALLLGEYPGTETVAGGLLVLAAIALRAALPAWRTARLQLRRGAP